MLGETSVLALKGEGQQNVVVRGTFFGAIRQA
jgi:hypothetical protein